MDEIERIQDTLEYRRAWKPYNAVSLGQAAQRLLAERISPQQAKFSQVDEVWRELLPAELLEHCEIVNISGGQLDVQVDSPAHVYELQLCSSELLSELQRQCPRARLTRIKLTVA
jgi:predicted nucleic acid-binding Zn ribbon protein